MVQDTLRLWTASRLVENTWRLVEQPLDPSTTVVGPLSQAQSTLIVKLHAVVQKVQNQVSRLIAWCRGSDNSYNTSSATAATESFGTFLHHAPVCRLLDEQIDSIIIRDIMGPMRQKVLGALHDRIRIKTRPQLVSIYIVVFILLHNIEHYIAREQQTDQWRNFNVRNLESSIAAVIHMLTYNKPDSTSTSDLESMRSSARAILAHWHYLSRCTGTGWVKSIETENLPEEEATFHHELCEVLDLESK